MGNEIETIYYLENPEKDLKTLATGSQLKYDDIIKDVFGVASIKDLPMMIQYNKSFQDSICSSKGVSENEITLEMVLRIASEMELLQLRKNMLTKLTMVRIWNYKNPHSPSILLLDYVKEFSNGIKKTFRTIW